MRHFLPVHLAFACVAEYLLLLFSYVALLGLWLYFCSSSFFPLMPFLFNELFSWKVKKLQYNILSILCQTQLKKKTKVR